MFKDDLNPTVRAVTQRIVDRSKVNRAAYLACCDDAQKPSTYRTGLGCANLAHAWAAAPAGDKLQLRTERAPNVGIISAYNDVLSAHQPYEHAPEVLRSVARSLGATAQVAAGVPAMCDGVTQGYDGMELSLFSRDVIAMATAIGLSHNTFDAVLCLGICDKIVPGLLIGALQFGHLPVAFVPSGPMPSGISNDEKSKVRQMFARGKVDRKTLLSSEEASYHSAGTCTFYGTANSNQMLMEIMGLQLPGSSFVNPGTQLRRALTEASVRHVLELRSKGLRLADVVNEKSIVNGIVGLLSTGGSTNHTLHLVAIARAAGITITWDDFSDLSSAIPLLARVYPNGAADVNQFQSAGGMGYVIQELLENGLLHNDVSTLAGSTLSQYAKAPKLSDSGLLKWVQIGRDSANDTILRRAKSPFSRSGGLQLMKGNLGRAIIKTSAVDPKHQTVRAPAVVVNSQQELNDLFLAGKLKKDFVAIVRYQGPKANGMPELHKLTPLLGSLQDEGYNVGLITDGRMSGASGKVPAAIHLSPEALDGGPIALVQDGDIVMLNAQTGELTLEVDESVLAKRSPSRPDLNANEQGTGRELFGLFRRNASSAELGASPLL
jgi:phosphogluconate dehydratase